MGGRYPRFDRDRLLQCLQLLARLEPDCFARRDGDFGSRSRVAADSGLARTHVEDAESPQLDSLALAQRVLHSFENGFDGHFGFRLSNARPALTTSLMISSLIKLSLPGRLWRGSMLPRFSLKHDALCSRWRRNSPSLPSKVRDREQNT